MHLDWLKNLLLLAETGHFSKAAERAYISQPAFSRRIQQLEDWVGLPLLDRSRYPVRLTPAGEEFAHTAHRILQDLERTKEALWEAYGNTRPTAVTFAVQHSISWSFYPSWLQEFERAFSGVQTHLRADDLGNCLKDLKEGRADFVICYETDMSQQDTRTDQLLSQGIGVDRFIPVSKPRPDGTPHYQLDDPGSWPIPLLSFGALAPLGKILEQFLNKKKMGDAVQSVYSNSMGSTLRYKARQGDGLAWLPESLVDGELRSGNLVVAGSRKWELELSIVLLCPRLTLQNHTEKIWERILENDD